MSAPTDDVPIMPPPAGTRSNFVDPPSYQPTLIVLEGVFMSLMLLAVAVRIYVRARIHRLWGWDDYTCIAAACGSVAHMIDYTQMFKIGYGRHLWDIQASIFFNTESARLIPSNGVIYAFTILLAKLSILFLYLRIFSVARRLRLAIYYGIIFQTLYYTCIAGVAGFGIWKCGSLKALEERFCLNYGRPVIVLNACVNIVTDIYVLALPIGHVLALQLSRKRKIGLLLVFASGFATCCVGLVRLIIFCIHYDNPDIMWIQGRNAQYTIVEINVAIIVACASCFPSFFSKAKILGSSVHNLVFSRLTPTRRSHSGSDRPSQPSHEPRDIEKQSCPKMWQISTINKDSENYTQLHDMHEIRAFCVDRDGRGDGF